MGHFGGPHLRAVPVPTGVGVVPGRDRCEPTHRTAPEDVAREMLSLLQLQRLLQHRCEAYTGSSGSF
jgi:hypothetical protein